MGQTLTHGVYLPDEGERNCYSGLAANWQILDNSVGTIATHTAALAGKAPAVHTHTKADITDFPAYGNSAGTICEGNDSRLSDARTPVAHTHGKADVTDLFNSANTWTALNTYANGQLALKATSQEIGVIPVSDKVQFISFNDKNSEQIGVVGIWYNSSGRTEMKFYVSDKYKDGVKDPTGTKTTETLSFGMTSDGNKFFVFEGKLGTSLYPFTTNFYNIGSSDNQWNNLYAKNYYYNGVAWGLDKANVWSQSNQFNGSIYSKAQARAFKLGGYPNDEFTVQPQSTFFSEIDFVDKNDTVQSYIVFQHRADATETHRMCFRVNRTQGNPYVSVNLNSNDELYPERNNAINLGTSTNKWKTLNGVNPGALSLPDMSSGTGVSLSAGSNSYSPPSSGWLSINLTGAISVVCGNFCHSGTDMLSVPVVKGSTYTVTVATSGTAYLFVSQGNV